MGAIEHASHFGWDATARGTLDIYDLVIGEAAHHWKRQWLALIHESLLKSFRFT